MGLAATSIQAETKKPASKWTCEEFLAVDATFQPKVIYWATAKTKAAGKTVDIDGTEKVIPIVIDECKLSPKESFWTKIRDAWRKVEADAKKLEKKL
jgi:acid stress chaperone HdeA